MVIDSRFFCFPFSFPSLLFQILEQQVLTVAKAVEDKLDDEIAALDRLDLDDLEALRERRRQQLKKMAEKRSQWISLGHGEYSEIAEKEFFAAVKASDRVVCHFYRENWPCKVPVPLALILRFAQERILFPFPIILSCWTGNVRN